MVATFWCCFEIFCILVVLDLRQLKTGFFRHFPQTVGLLPFVEGIQKGKINFVLRLQKQKKKSPEVAHMVIIHGVAHWSYDSTFGVW